MICISSPYLFLIFSYDQSVFDAKFVRNRSIYQSDICLTCARVTGVPLISCRSDAVPLAITPMILRISALITASTSDMISSMLMPG